MAIIMKQTAWDSLKCNNNSVPNDLLKCPCFKWKASNFKTTSCTYLLVVQVTKDTVHFHHSHYLLHQQWLKKHLCFLLSWHYKTKGTAVRSEKKKLANGDNKHGVISHLRLKAINTTDEKRASHCVSYFTFPPDRILENLHRRPSMICTSWEIQSETQK